MVVKHHARRLRGLARRVRDVEALDRQVIQALHRQIQRLGERARARLLRTLLGQQARQLNVGVLLRHVEPGPALLARLVHRHRTLAGLLPKCVQQVFIHRFANDQHRRHGHTQVVLRDEGRQHLLLLRRGRCVLSAVLGRVERCRVVHVRRKVGPVAQMPPATHHGQIDAGTPPLHTHGEDVDVLVLGRFNGLLVQHPRQRLHLVAQLRRLLELQLLGMREHARLQPLKQLLGLAAQQGLGALHIHRIGFGRHHAHAGGRTALDLEQQARPRAVGKHRVLAGAQAKHLLQQLDGFLHRPPVGVGAEVAVALVDGTAVVRHARKALPRCRALAIERCHASDSEEGVALVVAEQDVVLRVLRLDEVVLQQQRLGLGAHHGGLQARDFADHVADARPPVVLAEIAAHALFQVACLAYVEQQAGGVEIAVNARQLRQGGHLRQQFFGVRFVHGVIVRMPAWPHRQSRA